MEREVEQNELPIVNKNTRKKQKKSKMAKNGAKTPDKQNNPMQKNPMDLCGENRKIRKNSQKKQKNPIYTVYEFNFLYYGAMILYYTILFT